MLLFLINNQFHEHKQFMELEGRRGEGECPLTLGFSANKLTCVFNKLTGTARETIPDATPLITRPAYNIS